VGPITDCLPKCVLLRSASIRMSLHEVYMAMNCIFKIQQRYSFNEIIIKGRYSAEGILHDLGWVFRAPCPDTLTLNNCVKDCAYVPPGTGGYGACGQVPGLEAG